MRIATIRARRGQRRECGRARAGGRSGSRLPRLVQRVITRRSRQEPTPRRTTANARRDADLREHLGDAGSVRDDSPRTRRAPTRAGVRCATVLITYEKRGGALARSVRSVRHERARRPYPTMDGWRSGGNGDTRSSVRPRGGSCETGVDSSSFLADPVSERTRRRSSPSSAGRP